ncbi:hypothetical protein D5R40_07405 [Okeania hirsuta]|uniref:Uncharacterized protein n=1 Tax=Okeania hirsuta TaxID=1458930 RepID=A0A3N6PZ00_9CYAN|nr:hypothetical protein D4Z78_13770 [Okeania hirsuta]RQH49039.1 hypothetical protein D5R40_07405 [Okeania hirsuta]
MGINNGPLWEYLAPTTVVLNQKNYNRPLLQCTTTEKTKGLERWMEILIQFLNSNAMFNYHLPIKKIHSKLFEIWSKMSLLDRTPKNL